MKTPYAGSLRIPVLCQSEQGESAPKARQKCVVDGKQVNIPALKYDFDVVTEKARQANGWKC